MFPYLIFQMRVWVQQIPCESMICKGFFFVGYLKCTFLLMDKMFFHGNIDILASLYRLGKRHKTHV